MEPILQVKDLTHTYGAGTPFQRSAVEHMSFDVNEGEFLGIIGHTGSGKSTLIQHLNGLLQPTAGEILLRGKNIWAEPKKIREVRFKVGLVFQYPEYQLFEETVYKDIAFGPANQGKTGDELDHAVREAAKLVGIRDDQLEKSPFELSGGQKRRGGIWRSATAFCRCKHTAVSCAALVIRALSRWKSTTHNTPKRRKPLYSNVCARWRSGKRKRHEIRNPDRIDKRIFKKLPRLYRFAAGSRRDPPHFPLGRRGARLLWLSRFLSSRRAAPAHAAAPDGTHRICAGGPFLSVQFRR